MNKYILHIWKGLYHNDTFIRNLTRDQIVYAKSDIEAQGMARLSPEEKSELGELKILVGEEWVHDTFDQGRVEHSINVIFQMPNGLLDVHNMVEDPVEALLDAIRIIRNEDNMPLLQVSVKPTTFLEE